MLITLILISTLVFLVCYLIVLIKAFKHSFIHGLVCFLIWPYAFYYAFAKMESERKTLLATVLLLSALAGPGAAYFASSYLKPEIDDPCQYLAKEEVEKILDEPVGEPQRKLIAVDVGQMKACAYEAVERRRSIAIGFLPSCASLERARGIAREENPANLLDVSNVGREAFWTGKVLYVRSREQCFMVSVSDVPGGLSHQDRLEASKTLAMKVIRQLSGSR